MKDFIKYILVGGLASVAFTGPALAKDLGDGGVWSKERFQLRVRVIGVLPDGDGTESVTKLGTDVDDAVTPEVDITYFFTDNVAMELIAATSEHSISAGPNDIGDA